MAISSFNDLVIWPRLPDFAITDMTLANEALYNNNAWEYGFTFQIPKDGNISKALFGTAAVTFGGDYSFRFEGVTPANGYPDGVLIDSNAHFTKTILNTDNNMTFTESLTADVAVTMGQRVVFWWKSTGATPNMFFATLPDWGMMAAPHIMASVNNGSTWARQDGRCLIFGLEYDDGSYAQILNTYPASTAGILSFDSTKTPDVWGNQFSFTENTEVHGIATYANNYGDSEFKIWDSSGVVAGSVITREGQANPLGTTSEHGSYLFDAPITLSKDTNYIVGMERTQSINATLAYMDVDAAAKLGGFPGGGIFKSASAKDPVDSTDFTVLDTRMVCISLLVSGREEASVPMQVARGFAC